MKVGRTIGIGIAVVAVVVIAALIYVWSSLDSIVAAAIEKYGSQATQTSVRVSGVKLELTQGRGAISGLTVANPSGFSTPHVFSLGRISTAIDTATVTQDPIVISEIVVQAPTVSYEINDQGRSNINVIKDNLGGTKQGSKKESQPQTSGDTGPKLIIRRLVIDQGEIDVKIAALRDGERNAKLPRIELKDIGGDSGGATGAQVADRVITVLIERVVSSVASLGVDQYLGKTKEEIEQRAQQRLEDELDRQLGEGAGEQGTKALKKLLEK